MSQPYTIALGDDSADDGAITGPKMAGLAQLRNAGFLVPDAFTVPAHTFEAFLAENDLVAKLDEVLDGCDPDDEVDLEARAAAARSLIESAVLPTAIEESLRKAHDEFCGRLRQVNPQLAVRSSAIAEDSHDASFAGQFLTELGVVGDDDMVASVRRCWASLFAPRALAYRLRAGISLADCPMAVGVVRLVDARSSGVAFSRHPVTGRPDRFVIEATFGLGEALVSGQVTPDKVEVDSEDHRILDYTVGSKLVASAFDGRAGRVIEQSMPHSLRDERALTDGQVAAIASALGEIESMFDCPIDVEWVVDARSGDDTITFVQARPQTVHNDDPEPSTPSFLSTVMSTAFGVTEPPAVNEGAQ